MKLIRLKTEGTVFFVVLLLLGACGDTSKNSNALTQLDTLKSKPVEWHLDTLKKYVGEEYMNSVRERGRMYMEVTDKLTGKTWNLQLLGLSDTLYQSSKTVACVTANMRAFHQEPEKGEKVKADYQFVWDKEQGRFKIRNIFVRQVNEAVIYEWVKKGDYYERMNPEEKAALEEMDSTQITS